MTIWSDVDITNALGGGTIKVDPLPGMRQIQPASLELRIGETVVLFPNCFMLSHTLEVVSLDETVAAQLNGKSSLARLGLLIHSTGGWIDPGFSGQIVLELKNIGNQIITLTKHQLVAQLIFHPLQTPCARPYGHLGRDSHYQNQRGNRRSHLESDT